MNQDTKELGTATSCPDTRVAEILRLQTRLATHWPPPFLLWGVTCAAEATARSLSTNG